MRLKEFQIHQICQKVLHTLRSKQLIIYKADEGKILNRMIEIFTKDLKIEDDLNREVEKILDQYEVQMGNIDRQKMFQLVKKQLIKDRNLVI